MRYGMAYGSQSSHSSHSTKKVIEALRSRRKTKRSYEYECKWLNKSEEQNTWIEHEKLEDMGWAKMVQRLDQQEALRAGSATRPLTTTFVVASLCSTVSRCCSQSKQLLVLSL